MIFSELYSAYYHTVSEILTALLNRQAGEREAESIIAEHAFGESRLAILPALKNGKWKLLDDSGACLLKHPPTMPLSILEKRWLKAISLDPRIRLFGTELSLSDEITPLFTEKDYAVYDCYGDGDPYEDPAYQERFSFLLAAIRQKTPVLLCYESKRGELVKERCYPIGMEYSEKDDKFRLLTNGSRFLKTVNLAGIRSCQACEPFGGARDTRTVKVMETVTLSVTDTRNALERVLLHFAHFEKKAEHVEKNRYRVTIRYCTEDEAEIVIRILAFGPMVCVLEPTRMVNRIREKLRQQLLCDRESKQEN